MARRAQPELLHQLDAALELDREQRELAAQRDDLRRQVNDLSKQVGRLRRGRRRRRRRGGHGREPRASATARPTLARQADDVERDLRGVLLRIPNLPPPTPPTASPTPTTRSSHGPVGLPDAFADHQQVPHWETGAALGILDNERAVKISGAMFTMQRGPRRHAEPGAVPARPRPQRRRLRGDPAAVARHHRHADRHRPAAEVRRRRLRHRARRPVVHPHRRGAAHVDRAATRCSTRPTCRCGSWRTRRATGARPARPAGTPAACCAAHEFDKVEILAYTTPEQAPGMLDELRGPRRGD